MSNLAMKKAVKLAGGPVALGVACGVRYQAVQRWVKNGCPPKRVLLVHEVSGVSCNELRPDIYPIENQGAA